VTALTQKAHVIIDSLNVMGVDAIGIGDDDLTFGKEFLLECSRKARFPFLSSNVVDERSGKTLFSSSPDQGGQRSQGLEYSAFFLRRSSWDKRIPGSRDCSFDLLWT